MSEVTKSAGQAQENSTAPSADDAACGNQNVSVVPQDDQQEPVVTDSDTAPNHDPKLAAEMVRFMLSKRWD